MMKISVANWTDVRWKTSDRTRRRRSRFKKWKNEHQYCRIWFGILFRCHDCSGPKRMRNYFQFFSKMQSKRNGSSCGTSYGRQRRRRIVRRLKDVQVCSGSWATRKVLTRHTLVKSWKKKRMTERKVLYKVWTILAADALRIFTEKAEGDGRKFDVLRPWKSRRRSVVLTGYICVTTWHSEWEKFAIFTSWFQFGRIIWRMCTVLRVVSDLIEITFDFVVT